MGERSAAGSACPLSNHRLGVCRWSNCPRLPVIFAHLSLWPRLMSTKTPDKRSNKPQVNRYFSRVVTQFPIQLKMGGGETYDCRAFHSSEWCKLEELKLNRRTMQARPVDVPWRLGGECIHLLNQLQLPLDLGRPVYVCCGHGNRRRALNTNTPGWKAKKLQGGKEALKYRYMEQAEQTNKQLARLP